MSFHEKKEASQKISLLLISFIFLMGFFGGAALILYSYRNILNSNFKYSYNIIEPRHKENMPTFNALTELIQKEYAETINNDEIEKKSIKGLLNELDAHSTYLDGYVKSDFASKFDSSVGMVGMSLGVKNKNIIVLDLVPNSPAQKTGILKGDIIKKIGNEAIASGNLEEEVVKIRGEIGTNLTLTIERNGEHIPFQLTRTHIEVPSVASKIILEKKKHILYIKIDTFLEHTFKEIILNTLKYEHQKIDGVVIDVRDNPGGLLNSAIEISNLFLNDGNTVVHVANKNSQQTLTTNPYYWGESSLETLRDKLFSDKYNTAKTILSKLPLAVIINDESASASEIFAGTIQDYKRGVIIGNKSFGKGSVQQMYFLKNGDIIKLTTARFYTPKGTSIQGQGIIPDIIIPTTKKPEYTELALERALKNNGNLSIQFEEDESYNENFKYNTKVKVKSLKNNDYIKYAIQSIISKTKP